MKRPLYLLMATLLVVTMSELQTAGMMPYMAADLGVSTGTISSLARCYAEEGTP